MVLRLANFIELSCISVPIDRAFRRLMKIIASSIFPQLTHRVNIDFLETSAPIDSQNSSRTMSPRQRLHAMLLLYKNNAGQNVSFTPSWPTPLHYLPDAYLCP